MEKIAQVRFGIEKAERDYDRDFDGVGSAKPLEEERTQNIGKGGEVRSCYEVEPAGRSPNLRVSFSSLSGKRNEAMGSGNGSGGA